MTNVQMLAEECRRRGIRFVPATQQLTSMVARKEQMRGLTYIEEVRWVEEQLTKGRIFGDVEMETWLSAATRVESLFADRDASARQLLLTIDKTRFLLIHARLMADLREWATANAVDWVDMIEVLDLHRHYMLSWVHLHPKANRMIADAFATKILTACCATAKNQARTMAIDHQ